MEDTDRPALTFLTEYFYPEEASTAQLLSDLAVRLTDGFDVSVVTALPNYHPGDRAATVPRRETYESVTIERVRATRFDKDALPLRVLNWVTFTAMVAVRLLLQHGRRSALVVILSNPPVLPFSAWLNKRIWGTPYIYLIHDMYPDMPVELGMLKREGIVHRLWEAAIQGIYRDADRLVVLGGSMEQRLLEKMADDPGFDPAKVEVVPNWEDSDFIQPTEKSENAFARAQGTVDDFTLLYSGNIGRYHELKTVIDAFRLLKDRGRSDIQFLIIGEGGRKEEIRSYAERQGVNNVKFLPFQPIERLPETLTAADASLVGIVPEMEGICVSSKLYSSLAAGQPILAVVGENDEVAEVVRTHDCGSFAEQGDAKRVANMLETWADNPQLVEEYGSNARETFEQNYTLAHAADEYETLFGEILGSSDV